MDDVEEIKKLKARYFRSLDSKDWALYRSVFCEDCIVDTTKGGGALTHGIDEFMSYVGTLKAVQTVHHGHMPEIELTGPNTATGIWSMEDYNLWEDGSQNHGWGHYLETYEKRGGRWQIKTMQLSYLRFERSLGVPPVIAGSEGTAHLRGTDPSSRRWGKTG